MERAKSACEVKPGRDTASTEVMEFLSALAIRADETAAKVHEKLLPVCLVLPPGKEAVDRICREYPPLFNDMRDKLEIIGRALVVINNTMDSCEI